MIVSWHTRAHGRLSRSISTFVSINGKPASNPAAASVSIYDESFQRGDGVFEVVRVLVGDKVVPRLGSEDNLNVKASGVIN